MEKSQKEQNMFIKFLVGKIDFVLKYVHVDILRLEGMFYLFIAMHCNALFSIIYLFSKKIEITGIHGILTFADSGQKFKRLDRQNLSPSLSVSTLVSDTDAPQILAEVLNWL